MIRFWFVIFGMVLFSPKIHAAPPVSFTNSELPIVVINTSGQTIVDEPKIMVDMGIIYNGVGVPNNVTDPFNNYNGKITIEIRGSSSQSFPQKSYSFTTVDNLSQEINPYLLGMPAEHDWILYAPYTDKALIRNVLTYRLAADMGYYAPRTRFCELVIDGSYQGVYVLMEKIKRDNKRVDISKMTVTDIAGDQLTGGYIVKIDKTTGNGGAGWYSSYPSTNNSSYPYFQYHYPKDDVITQEQKDYVQNYFDDFEYALKASYYKDPLIGYAKFMEVNSFIDFLIVNEISRNVDGYRLSSFFYKGKDSLGGKITAGPLWDFNLAWWNADYCEGYNANGWSYLFPQYCGWDGFQPPFWWERLISDDAFKNKLRCRWNYLRGDILSSARLNSMIDAYADTLTVPQGRHFSQWPILGNYVWPNPSPLATTYSGEIANLKQWVSDRTTWLDANMPGNCASQPVYILGMSSTCVNSSMRIEWKTYSEKNVQHYEVQRRNAAGVYTTVGTVLADNLNGEKTYQYDDAVPTNDNFMYRIAVVPLSGVTDYTKTIRVKKCNVFLTSVKEEQSINESILVVPNPSSSEMSIHSGEESVSGYDLYTLAGKHIGGSRFALTKEPITIKETSDLVQGLYTLKIYSGNKTVVKKIIRN